MINLKTVPGRMKTLLILCLVGIIVSIGTTFWVYSTVRNVSQRVGKDAIPQIIAARHIKATLADAHSSAMNAMVT